MNSFRPGIELDRQQFLTCWNALRAREVPWGRDDTAFEVLRRCYGEAHRAYHTAEHIEECIGWWQRLSSLAERPQELAAAIYFHDAVYDPTRGDNETRSAQLFEELAREAGVDAAAIERVKALITSTAAHGAAAGDAALLSDIDLAVLGASPARYARFERAVRQEYAMFGDDAYRGGRAQVLSSFLERLAIYRTEPMASLLERQARSNLSWALGSLQQPRRQACSGS